MIKISENIEIIKTEKIKGQYYIFYRDNETGFIFRQVKYNFGKYYPSGVLQRSLQEEYLISNLKILCSNSGYIFMNIVSNDNKGIYILVKCKDCDRLAIISANSIVNRHGCLACSDSIPKTYEFIKEAFEKEGYLLITKEYKNAHTKLLCTCPKHTDVIMATTWNRFQQGKRCLLCRIENREKEKNCNWQGGTTPIYSYLRTKLHYWNIDSMKECGMKCIISGETNKKKLVVHHLEPFCNIFNKTLNEFNLTRNVLICDIEEEKLNSLTEYFIGEHYNLMGVCITKEIHKHFHTEYGKTPSPNDFWEFYSKMTQEIHVIEGE